MERSVEKADVSDVPRKSRPLDSLSVSAGKSATPSARLRAKDGALAAASKSKVVKRKRSSSLENGTPSLEFRKRSGKAVSLNSFVKGSRKGKLRVGVSVFKANGLVSGVGKQEKPSSSSVAVRTLRNVSDTSLNVGNDFTLPSGRDENQLSIAGDLHSSNGLEGRIIITKRPRGVLRRKKIVQSVNLDREIVGASSSTRSTTDQRSNKLSVSQSQIRKPRRKLTEFKEDGSTDNGSHSCKENSGNLYPVKATKRRFQGRKGQDSNLLDNKDYLLNSLGVFRDDDEDNLEQNAARMLSSRFDPSCAGFSHSRVASPKPAKESSLVLSQRNLNSSGAEINATGRVLRPRKHGGRGFARKRRHFYEVCSNNMDPYWVVKQRIRVFWPLDKCWYFGLVKDYDPVTKMHHVKYDDRDEEWINLQNERFKLLLFPSEVANKFSHERSIKEVKNRDKEGHKRSMHDLSTGGLVETEPIISWLTRSSRRERPSALGIIKTQRRILSASKSFKPVGIPNAVSNLSSSLLDGSTEDYSTQNRICSENRKLPFVYFRRRIRKDGGYLGNIMERNSDQAGSAGPITLLASVADTESAMEELYITVIPQVLTKVTVRLSSPIRDRCQSMLGSDIFLMCRSLFHLHNYKLIQLLPLVRMEVGLTDNLSLKLFLFEGCLSLAVVLLCQMLRENYCHKNSHTPSAENMPLKKIRINMSNLHNNSLKLHFVVDGFMESNSRWRYLEKKLKKHCIRFKEFSPADFAYDHVKKLSIRCDGTVVQPFKETVPVEDNKESNDKLNHFPVEESDQVSDITLENFGSPSTAATDSKLSSFAHLRIETDALSLSNDGDCLRSSHDCLSIEVNGGACSVGYSDVGKNSSDEMFVQYHKLPEHTRSYQGSENLCSSFPDDPSSPDKSEGGCISSSKTAGIPALRGTRAEEQTLYRGTQDVHSASNLLWEMNEHAIHGSNATAPRSVWHHNRHSVVSPILGPRSTLWSEDFIQSGFLSTTKKPRTQVSYPVLSRGHDIRSKNRIHHRNGSLYKKLRADLPKKFTVGLESHRSFQESLTCYANVLITAEDRGWREFGAEIILDSDDQKDWKIVVKLAGVTKFSYKAHQVLQPGIPNRYTHAMMWKGGKDWSLEFTDRNQWLLFKMMHGQCFNQNIRAASVKNIPIPGVRLIDDGDESLTEVPFVRNSSKYYQVVGTEVEMALDSSHVLYDMDSDDEDWISKFRDSLDNNDSTTCEVTDDMFERVMDMFEKVAYVKQCDCLNDDEIAEFMEDFGSLDIVKAIHELWHEKRRKKGMPLIRQYQPPLWECYQQQLKEWELAMIKLHYPANECQEKTTAPEKPPEKPPMFAFCLKPRGLEANKGSKQRSHKKLMYTGHNSSFSREQDGLHASGRRLNVSPIGDEKALVAIPSYEGSHSTQWFQSSMSFSPRDARTAILMASDGVDRTHYPKLFRNFSKKNGMHQTPWDSSVMPVSCSEKSKRNGVYRWNSDTLEWMNSKHLQPDGAQRQPPDVNEFRLRDASGAAQHASNMAKLKREKAQWLMHKADLALHKAVVAIMTADAIKTSQKDLIGDK